tara:strand:+ start:241 stop:633 length:393 start_codon:yes stop_codon:yes gene_type:complete
MTIYTGKDGSFKFDGQTQIRVKSWSIDASLAMLEVTRLGDDAVQNEAGLKSFTGSATLMYHDDDTTLSSMLDNIFTKDEPTKAAAVFEWGAKRIKFNAFITSATLGMSTGEIMTADVSFTNADDLSAITL